MARTRLYRNGVLDAEGFGIRSLSEHLTDPSCVVWVDLCQPGEDDLRVIADELQLHDLAVEHAMEPHDGPRSTATAATCS
jgi:magnesium transporter